MVKSYYPNYAIKHYEQEGSVLTRFIFDLEGWTKNYGYGKHLNVAPFSDVFIGNDITEIAPRAFYGSPTAAVVIPPSVQEIGDEAFYRCFNLSRVYMTRELFDSIKDRIWDIFDTTNVLSDIRDPYGNVLFSIQYMPFHVVDLYGVDAGKSVYECGYLNAVVTGLDDRFSSVCLPEGLRVLGEGAFANCNQLVHLQLPRTISGIIKTYTFLNCRHLTKVVLPKSLWLSHRMGDPTYFQNYFYGCPVDIHVYSEEGELLYPYKVGQKEPVVPINIFLIRPLTIEDVLRRLREIELEWLRWVEERKRRRAPQPPQEPQRGRVRYW